MSGRYLPLSAFAVAITTFVTGVAAASDSATVATHRARLLLSEPTQQATAVLATQKQLVEEKRRTGVVPKEREVVLVGQIGGMLNVWPDTHPNFPWYPGQASFFMVDSKVAQEFAQHTTRHGGGHDCAFCRQLAAKNVNAIAVVNLLDEQGKTLKIDLRELLDLKENQTVTIRGKAKLLAGSLLQIDADGIYVKPPATAARATNKSSR
jgi:hypothetical protein